MVSDSNTILLVEDDLDVQEMTRLMLEDGGYRVIAVMNGTEALLSLAREQPISAVISDIHTRGGIDGIQLVLRLRQAGLHTPAILTSGDLPNRYGDYPESVTFVPKPYDRHALLEALSSVLS